MVRKSLFALTLTALCLALTSCAVLNVHHVGVGVGGVPFYTKTAICHHEAVWIEPVYTLTLQTVSVDSSGKETVTPVGSADFSLSGFIANQPAITNLKKAIATGAPGIPGLWTPLQLLTSYNPLAQAMPAEDVVLASNTNTLESQVDYRDVYYFNSHRPIIGSAQADVKLNADLTLSEGSGQLESKTLQSFLDLFPISALISKAAGIGAGGGGGGPAAPNYRLQVESRGIKHTLSRYDPADPLPDSPCDPQPAPAFNDATYNRTRDDIPAEAKPKEDKNSIKVSGEIKLPSKDQK